MAFLISTRSAARTYELARQRGLVAEAQVSKRILTDALDSIVRAYRDMIDAIEREGKLPQHARDFLTDQLGGLRDEFNSLDHRWNVQIDEGGEVFENIDMGELDELRARVAK